MMIPNLTQVAYSYPLYSQRNLRMLTELQSDVHPRCKINL